ncbi:MAG: hypothetical protein RR128_04705, partial [Clostridium sp.]
MKLEEENISFIHENVNAIFPLNLIVSNFRNSINKVFNTIELPELIKEEEKEIARRLTSILSKRDKEIVYHIESSKGLRYMGFGIYEEETYQGVLVLGPYLDDIIPSVLLEEEERFFYEGITVINKSQEKSIANIVATLINSRNVTKAVLEEDDRNLGVRRFNYTLDDYEKNLAWIKKMYKTERQLLHYVSQGNKDIALELVNTDSYERVNQINRFPEKPIRNVKNLSIVFNTLLRKSIEGEGIDEYFIHKTSENFAIKIENSLTIRELMSLMSDMVSDYCDLVKEYNTRVYSELVSNAITFIKLNFKKEISLNNIARELFIHPTY